MHTAPDSSGIHMKWLLEAADAGAAATSARKLLVCLKKQCESSPGTLDCTTNWAIVAAVDAVTAGMWTRRWRKRICGTPFRRRNRPRSASWAKILDALGNLRSCGVSDAAALKEAIACHREAARSLSPRGPVRRTGGAEEFNQANASVRIVPETGNPDKWTEAIPHYENALKVGPAGTIRTATRRL